MFQLLMSVKPT